jgi:ABC-type phosphate transport system substrate-binding protein
MNRIANMLAILAVVVVTAARAGTADTFVVVVNPANSAPLSRADIANIFMKRITRWGPDDLAIAVVDQVPHAPVRAAFSAAILRRGVEAMQAYWQQQIFSGRDVPPVEKESDAEVVAYVRRNRGAIGYVSEGAAIDGVRVVHWK